jgi:putative Holliday junction resolvase
MTNVIKYLGIDYGKSKVGLSLAESETKIAFAYGTLKNNKQLFTELAEIIKKEGVSKVIIGVPGFNNGDKESQETYHNFGKILQEKFPQVEIGYAEEMFTTKMAQEKLKEKGIKNIKELDDQEAAKIILQSWLDL